MGDSEPADIFQHQSTGYLRTRGQETLYETCACVIHTNLQLHYYSTMRHSTIDLSLFNTSEESLRDWHFLTGYPSTKGQEVWVYQTCACVIHIYLHTLSAAYCHLTLMFVRGTCASWSSSLYMANVSNSECGAIPNCCIVLCIGSNPQPLCSPNRTWAQREQVSSKSITGQQLNNWSLLHIYTTFIATHKWIITGSKSDHRFTTGMHDE